MGVCNLECILMVVSFVALWALHWTRWAVVAPAIVDEDGQPLLVWRYVIGVGAIVLVFVAWAALVSERLVSPWDAAAFLVGDVAAAGLATVLPRVLAMRHELAALEGDREARDAALEARQRDP